MKWCIAFGQSGRPWRDTGIEVEIKDQIALVGIGITFLVSFANLLYSWRSNRRTSFVNTVTASRLRWIDSLRDKVSEYIAVTARLSDGTPPVGDKNSGALLLQRDTLLHQIVLHLNPRDSEDRAIKGLVDHVREITDQGDLSGELQGALLRLRDATAEYLKKEWNRVKTESTRGQS
jgi:hypothetical protein